MEVNVAIIKLMIFYTNNIIHVVNNELLAELSASHNTSISLQFLCERQKHF